MTMTSSNGDKSARPCRDLDDSRPIPRHIGHVMRLIDRSPRASQAVRTVSPAGELFVASVVVFMILASFGDAVDPMLFGEAGLEFVLFDFGGEFTLLAMRHWHLLQLLLAGGAAAAGLAVLWVCTRLLLKVLRPAPRQADDKVPIEL
jgi:hypothetical protein